MSFSDSVLLAPANGLMRLKEQRTERPPRLRLPHLPDLGQQAPFLLTSAPLVSHSDRGPQWIHSLFSAVCFHSLPETGFTGSLGIQCPSWYGAVIGPASCHSQSTPAPPTSLWKPQIRSRWKYTQPKMFTSLSSAYLEDEPVIAVLAN